MKQIMAMVVITGILLIVVGCGGSISVANSRYSYVSAAGTVLNFAFSDNSVKMFEGILQTGNCYLEYPYHVSGNIVYIIPAKKTGMDSVTLKSSDGGKTLINDSGISYTRM